MSFHVECGEKKTMTILGTPGFDIGNVRVGLTKDG